jgi:hypothetical protein
MGDYFIVSEEKRNSFIEKDILGLLDGNGAGIESRIYELVRLYEGQDLNALSVLAYAANNGVLTDYVNKLTDYYKKQVQFVHPSARVIHSKIESFFLTCYKELNIKPAKE